MSITYKAKKVRRKKKHGFLKRQGTKGGKKVLQKRRAKKRRALTV